MRKETSRAGNSAPNAAYIPVLRLDCLESERRQDRRGPDPGHRLKRYHATLPVIGRLIAGGAGCTRWPQVGRTKSLRSMVTEIARLGELVASISAAPRVRFISPDRWRGGVDWHQLGSDSPESKHRGARLLGLIGAASENRRSLDQAPDHGSPLWTVRIHFSCESRRTDLGRSPVHVE